MSADLKIVKQWLDEAFNLFKTGAWSEGLLLVANKVNETYLKFGPDRFKNEVLSVCLSHPLRQVIHQDPYTRHSFYRPRGYAGDAALIDFIYGLRSPETTDTELGRFIFSEHMQSSAAKSVRYRSAFLGERIEKLARTGSKEVLAVACGHLREALFAPSLRTNPEFRITALDQDAQSIRVVQEMKEREGFAGITTLHSDLKPIFFGRFGKARWDFIYSAGVYDYLPDKLARRLTRKMFDLVRPGGSLLIANFKPNLYERGYMELYMNWHLIFRQKNEIEELTSQISTNEILALKSHLDPEMNILYLEIIKN